MHDPDDPADRTPPDPFPRDGRNAYWQGVWRSWLRCRAVGDVRIFAPILEGLRVRVARDLFAATRSASVNHRANAYTAIPALASAPVCTQTAWEDGVAIGMALGRTLAAVEDVMEGADLAAIARDVDLAAFAAFHVPPPASA